MKKLLTSLLLCTALLIPGSAYALSYSDLIVEFVSIPVTSPKKALWLEKACPDNLWYLSTDNKSIICEFENADGDHVTTVLKLNG